MFVCVCFPGQITRVLMVVYKIVHVCVCLLADQSQERRCSFTKLCMSVCVFFQAKSQERWWSLTYLCMSVCVFLQASYKSVGGHWLNCACLCLSDCRPVTKVLVVIYKIVHVCVCLLTDQSQECWWLFTKLCMSVCVCLLAGQSQVLRSVSWRCSACTGNWADVHVLI